MRAYLTNRVLRHFRRPRQLLFVTVCGLSVATGASTAEIWVVTDSRHPVKAPSDVRLIELDAPARMEEQLAAQLPSDLTQATAIVQRRLKEGGASLQRRLATAYQGTLDAWNLGVSKIPAIVVDRRYVVYGEQDITRAVSRIQKYRSSQP